MMRENDGEVGDMYGKTGALWIRTRMHLPVEGRGGMVGSVEQKCNRVSAATFWSEDSHTSPPPPAGKERRLAFEGGAVTSTKSPRHTKVGTATTTTTTTTQVEVLLCMYQLFPLLSQLHMVNGDDTRGSYEMLENAQHRLQTC